MAKDLNFMLLSDFYKQYHDLMYPKGITRLASFGTARSSRIKQFDSMVIFRLQSYCQEFLIDWANETFFNVDRETAVNEVYEFLSETCSNKFNKSKLEALHDLGYLPVEAWTLPEGTECPIYEQWEIEAASSCGEQIAKVPYMMFINTHPDFAWVPEFLESITLCETWYPMLVATMFKKTYREIVNKHWKISVVGQPANTALSEFGFRSSKGLEAATMASSAMLLSFSKTATIPAIAYNKKYYGKDMQLKEIGGGMISTEHSVACSNFAVDGNEDDFMIRALTEIVPDGNISFVADSYDYYGRIQAAGEKESKVKMAITTRDGTLYLRGDSGNPVDIICGTKTFINVENMNEAIKKAATIMWEGWETYEHTDDGVVDNSNNEPPLFRVMRSDNTFDYYKGFKDPFNCNVTVIEYMPTLEELGTIEAFYNRFGGIINDKGYILLDNHVRGIYGDSITPYRMEQIYTKLEEKGFAANNVALGAGGFSTNCMEEIIKGEKVIQPFTRDTFGLAFKATYCEVGDKPYNIFKDPKTDSDKGKKSQCGMIAVFKDEGGKIKAVDGLDYEQFLKVNTMLQVVFRNGKMVKEENLRTIRDRLHNGNF